MPIYEFKCPKGHVTEYTMTFREYSNHKKYCTSIDSLSFVECNHKDQEGFVSCGIRAFQIITNTSLPKYNATGFYGSIPTDLAHNTGQV